VIVDDVGPATPPHAHRAEPLPVLGRGRHPNAESGVCLMEFTALLAGEDLTDRPRCVHPLVAAVARVVNDSVSDAARAQLLARGPAFLTSNSDDSRIADRITLTAIETALPVALPLWAPRLRRERRRRLGKRSRALSSRRMRSEERTVTLAAASLAVAPIEHHDEELIRLLDDVLTVAGGASGRSRHS
jgi:hypothetical protein